jgi:beta-carotene/zeaxanthin 4-ketolase
VISSQKNPNQQSPTVVFGDTKTSWLSLAIACGVIAVWAFSLVTLLRLETSKLNSAGIVVGLLWQMFLYTGLFITAHDAMHGIVFPKNPQINDFIGSLILRLYGLFSYKELLKTHQQHHKHPASELDPDYHNGRHKNFFSWYFNFMCSYWNWLRFLGLVAVFHFMHRILHVPESNLILFWILPSVLSSVQLFYFGTFLPHKEPPAGYQNPYRAQSIYRPWFWSFITCYHFGYHREHHEFPHVPWWGLPAIVKGARG